MTQQEQVFSSNGGRTEILARFPFLGDTVASPIRGGRRAALQALEAIDPEHYTRSRNFLAGAVTRLSPYLRHGVLTLAEVRDFTLDKVKRFEDAEKLINELAWRDYWQRLYRVLGAEVWNDLEGYKTGYAAENYGERVPDDLLAGTTGLRCMDAFSGQLRGTGYLHNHARMWMAAYLVHWLRVRWQAGAAWFLEHLLDGDPASNNLSWQWVASTFSQKPYFFNRENLERYTDGEYCRNCSARKACPFERSYEGLESELFRIAKPEEGRMRPLRSEPDGTEAEPSRLSKPLVWVHTDALNPESRVLLDNPEAPACFVWDTGWLREAHISGKRVVFLHECLEEMPARVERREGEIGREILAAAEGAGADHVLAQRTPDPRLLAAGAVIAAKLPVVWVNPPSFVDDGRSYDLNRFSKYWRTAKYGAMRKTA